MKSGLGFQQRNKRQKIIENENHTIGRQSRQLDDEYIPPIRKAK